MSVTYTDNGSDLNRPLDGEGAYVPAYARSRKSARKSKGGIKTWMILAPIGVVTIGGIGAAMMMGGEQASVVEAEATTPAPLVSQSMPTQTATTAMTSPAMPAPVEVAPTPAPVSVAREVAPVRESVPVRRTAPRAAAPAVTPRVEAEPVLTGPQPYSAVPSATPTSTLNRAPVVVSPAPTPTAPATPAPVIVVQPAG